MKPITANDLELLVLLLPTALLCLACAIGRILGSRLGKGQDGKKD